MSDDPNALARAVARINDLTAALATAEQARAAALANLAKVAAERDAATAQIAGIAPLRAELAHLQSLLADPPPGGGVTLVCYLAHDGSVDKKRYRCTDGSKFKLLPDALRQQAKVDIIATLGVSDSVAEEIIAKGDAVQQHLAALKP